MGMALLCDGCQRDIALEDKVSVQVAALDGSASQLDFCWECARPIRALDPVKNEMRAKRMEIIERQEEIRLSLTEPTPAPVYVNSNADVDPDPEPDPGVVQ